MTPDELRAAADRATELLDAATPGPWEYNDAFVANGDYVIICAGNRYVAHTNAHAHLIAAAPDLLAVLAPAARQYADTQDECERLQLWKDEALSVLAGWDKVYAALDPTDAPLGEMRFSIALREVQRLRQLCEFLIDACAEHRIPVPINSSLLDLAADIASDDVAADPEGEPGRHCQNCGGEGEIVEGSGHDLDLIVTYPCPTCAPDTDRTQR